MNNKEVVHPNDDVTDDDYSNIKDHATQHNRSTETIVFTLLLIINYNQTLI